LVLFCFLLVLAPNFTLFLLFSVYEMKQRAAFDGPTPPVINGRKVVSAITVRPILAVILFTRFEKIFPKIIDSKRFTRDVQLNENFFASSLVGFVVFFSQKENERRKTKNYSSEISFEREIYVFLVKRKHK
jgi:hypothetical protein